MSVRRAGVEDLDRVLELLTQRREPLAGRAPVFWRPAADAAERHREYLVYVITAGGGRAYLSDHGVMITAPRGPGWLVDDAYVTGERWLELPDGLDLWAAFAGDSEGAPVRLVCPTFETTRSAYASRVGLQVQESWWLKEMGATGGQVGADVDIPGTTAVLMAAPPVYEPGGPVLYLPDLHGSPDEQAASAAVEDAVQEALDRAAGLGCSSVVVNQPAGDEALAARLTSAGLARHCDFFAGTIHQP